MGQLWGVNPSNESKPNWLNNKQIENCYATSAGWMLRYPDGTEELLVAVAGLSLGTKLGNATVVAVTFGTGTYTAGTTKTVKVQFNEKVTVTGSPTLVVTGSVAGAITATYASNNAAGSTLTFNFTVPAAANVLSVAAQSISLAGGTIVDAGTATASSLVISAAARANTGTKTAV